MLPILPAAAHESGYGPNPEVSGMSPFAPLSEHSGHQTASPIYEYTPWSAVFVLIQRGRGAEVQGAGKLGGENEVVNFRRGFGLREWVMGI